MTHRQRWLAIYETSAPLAGADSKPNPQINMQIMTHRNWITASLWIFSGILNGAELANGDFKVELAQDFPGLVSYAFKGNPVTLPAIANRVIRLNGEDFQPQVRLVLVGTDRANYELTFKEAAVSMTARVVVSRNSLTITLTDVREYGSFVVRSIEMPGMVLLAGHAENEVALGNFPAGSYASENPADHDRIGKLGEISFPDNDKTKDKNRDPQGHIGASYAFVSDGKVAAGLYPNVMEENLRMIVQLNGDGPDRAVSVAPGKWTYREIPTEICPAPVVMLVVAADNNGDGKVTWQDAAVAYRRSVPQPYGGEKTKDYPLAHIAMNFASQATHPFLRVLDNAKKLWLYTDGLGQRIQYKGYQSEGHDSSHPDYAGNVGIRQGGREQLNFAMRRGHDFNVLSGIHINAHEYHKEAHNFSPDIADVNAVGWSWLDESYLTDYRYDTAYGTLYQRLDAMREDLPWLDFAYLDVYYGRGWPGWRMHTKNNNNGIMQFTEFPGVMERAVVWNHVANDWTQAIGGKGDRSEIARFIWFSQKDTFKHDPLLRGSNCDGFMGWHAEHNMLQTLKSAFTVNLPTKYLQHFDLIRQEKNAAWFAGGPRSESDGETAKVFGRDGQLINSCRYEKPNTRPVDNLSFIPWESNSESKIYHWNDKGGDSTWDLPKSWAALQSAQLYRLTDLGRVFERDIPLANGKVTLTGIEPNTPYVLYRESPPALPDMKWGEGGLVRDPGFDSHSFTAWKAGVAEVASFENDKDFGQTELVMDKPIDMLVRQTVTGLTPGQTYAASVWVNITGTRPTVLGVSVPAPSPPPFIDRGSWKVISSTKSLGGDRPPKMFDGNPKTHWHSVEAKDDNKLPHQVTVSFGRQLDLTGFTQTCRADMGNGVIKGFEAQVSPDNKAWATVAMGDFDYGNGTTATVKFDRTVTAGFFRLIAKSELKDRPFTSIAELDMLVAQNRKPQSADPSRLLGGNDISTTSLINYTDQSDKYMRPWHRLKVVFTAPADGMVDLELISGAGSPGSKVRFDDVRLVKTGVSKARKTAGKVVLFEDFENVDEGWGPFMYGWEGPMNTHLSEANPPYTDDTIQGKFSLKSRREGSPGMVYRTVPATLKLKPDTTYQVSFDYLCDTADCFALVSGIDGPDGQKVETKEVIPDGSWKVRKCNATIKTGTAPDTFLGISKLTKDKTGTLVIDNFLVTE